MQLINYFNSLLSKVTYKVLYSIYSAFYDTLNKFYSDNTVLLQAVPCLIPPSALHCDRLHHTVFSYSAWCGSITHHGD